MAVEIYYEKQEIVNLLGRLSIELRLTDFLETAMRRLDEVPRANVIPFGIGTWNSNRASLRCSKCGEFIHDDIAKKLCFTRFSTLPHCPCCGASMSAEAGSNENREML